MEKKSKLNWNQENFPASAAKKKSLVTWIIHTEARACFRCAGIEYWSTKCILWRVYRSIPTVSFHSVTVENLCPAKCRYLGAQYGFRFLMKVLLPGCAVAWLLMLAPIFRTDVLGSIEVEDISVVIICALPVWREPRVLAIEGQSYGQSNQVPENRILTWPRQLSIQWLNFEMVSRTCIRVPMLAYYTWNRGREFSLPLIG